MKNKNILLVLCMLLIISTIALGCSPAERPVPETTPNNQNIDRNGIDERTLPESEIERNDRLDMDNELDMDNDLDVNDRIDENNRTNTNGQNNR